MKRKRLTQIMPWLLPLRQKQRKLFFYLGMRFDGKHYAEKFSANDLKYEVYRTESVMVNEDSGYDIRYQYNKVHNLMLAARTMHRILIMPGETFSFYQRVRQADREIPFRDGLNLVYGKMVTTPGGGLCQLSNLLYWMFLHTPLTITERHGHQIDAFARHDDLPEGIDATISEGWKDLKVTNDTNQVYQILITFDEKHIIGTIRSDAPNKYQYEIYNASVKYVQAEDGIFKQALVNQARTSLRTNRTEHRLLYENRARVGYPLSKDIKIEKESV